MAIEASEKRQAKAPAVNDKVVKLTDLRIQSETIPRVSYLGCMELECTTSEYAEVVLRVDLDKMPRVRLMKIIDVLENLG